MTYLYHFTWEFWEEQGTECEETTFTESGAELLTCTNILTLCV